jgi:hypothetical protein
MIHISVFGGEDADVKELDVVPQTDGTSAIADLSVISQEIELFIITTVRTLNAITRTSVAYT